MKVDASGPVLQQGQTPTLVLQAAPVGQQQNALGSRPTIITSLGQIQPLAGIGLEQAITLLRASGVSVAQAEGQGAGGGGNGGGPGQPHAQQQQQQAGMGGHTHGSSAAAAAAASAAAALVDVSQARKRKRPGEGGDGPVAGGHGAPPVLSPPPRLSALPPNAAAAIAEETLDKDSPCRNQTGYIGVRQRKWGMFAAEIRDGDKRRWLGSFQTSMEAGLAYDAAAIVQKGTKAKTNFYYNDYETNPRTNAEVVDTVRWDLLPEDIAQQMHSRNVPRKAPRSEAGDGTGGPPAGARAKPKATSASMPLPAAPKGAARSGQAAAAAGSRLGQASGPGQGSVAGTPVGAGPGRGGVGAPGSGGGHSAMAPSAGPPGHARAPSTASPGAAGGPSMMRPPSTSSGAVGTMGRGPSLGGPSSAMQPGSGHHGQQQQQQHTSQHGAHQQPSHSPPMQQMQGQRHFSLPSGGGGMQQGQQHGGDRGHAAQQEDAPTAAGAAANAGMGQQNAGQGMEPGSGGNRPRGTMPPLDLELEPPGAGPSSNRMPTLDFGSGHATTLQLGGLHSAPLLHSHPSLSNSSGGAGAGGPHSYMHGGHAHSGPPGGGGPSSGGGAMPSHRGAPYPSSAYTYAPMGPMHDPYYAYGPPLEYIEDEEGGYYAYAYYGDEGPPGAGYYEHPAAPGYYYVHPHYAAYYMDPSMYGPDGEYLGPEDEPPQQPPHGHPHAQHAYAPPASHMPPPLPHTGSGALMSMPGSGAPLAEQRSVGSGGSGSFGGSLLGSLGGAPQYPLFKLRKHGGTAGGASSGSSGGAAAAAAAAAALGGSHGGAGPAVGGHGSGDLGHNDSLGHGHVLQLQGGPGGQETGAAADGAGGQGGGSEGGYDAQQHHAPASMSTGSGAQHRKMSRHAHGSHPGSTPLDLLYPGGPYGGPPGPYNPAPVLFVPPGSKGSRGGASAGSGRPGAGPSGHEVQPGPGPGRRPGSAPAGSLAKTSQHSGPGAAGGDGTMIDDAAYQAQGPYEHSYPIHPLDLTSGGYLPPPHHHGHSPYPMHAWPPHHGGLSGGGAKPRAPPYHAPPPHHGLPPHHHYPGGMQPGDSGDPGLDPEGGPMGPDAAGRYYMPGPYDEMDEEGEYGGFPPYAYYGHGPYGYGHAPVVHSGHPPPLFVAHSGGHPYAPRHYHPSAGQDEGPEEGPEGHEGMPMGGAPPGGGRPMGRYGGPHGHHSYPPGAGSGPPQYSGYPPGSMAPGGSGGGAGPADIAGGHGPGPGRMPGGQGHYSRQSLHSHSHGGGQHPGGSEGGGGGGGHGMHGGRPGSAHGGGGSGMGGAAGSPARLHLSSGGGAPPGGSRGGSGGSGGGHPDDYKLYYQKFQELTEAVNRIAAQGGSSGGGAGTALDEVMGKLQFFTQMGGQQSGGGGSQQGHGGSEGGAQPPKH